MVYSGTMDTRGWGSTLTVAMEMRTKLRQVSDQEMVSENRVHSFKICYLSFQCHQEMENKSI